MKKFAFSPVTVFLGCFVAITFLPLGYNDSVFSSLVFWRLASCVLGLVLYFILLQLPLVQRHRLQWVLWAILLLALIEAGITLAQVFFPHAQWTPFPGDRPWGSFRQPNVLASFLATGLVLAATLFILPAFRLATPKKEPLRLTLLACLLLLFSASLVWAQSRAGWIGAVLAVVLCGLLFGKSCKKRCCQAFGWMLAGVLAGIGVMLWQHNEGIDHSGSNLARWSMYRDALAMVRQRPVTGWGYGQFEYAFQHFRVHQIPPTIPGQIASHPHNELLYWWIEGGAPGLLAMLLLLIAGIKLWLRARREDRVALAVGSPRAGVATALCLALLPMLLHTQLEYPFYQSTRHFALFILLLALADQASGGVRYWYPQRWLAVALCSAVLITTISGLVIIGYGAWGQRLLAKAEQGGLQEMKAVVQMPRLSAWTHRERRDFDLHVASLQHYNQTRDEGILSAFVPWAQGYLQLKVDANVYADLISILLWHRQRQLAEYYRNEASLLFPRDPRFIPFKRDAG